jgi:lactate racemase
MAADIGIDATTSLDEAFQEAMQRHGQDAKIIVLPYARYQLPRNAVRLEAEPFRFPQERPRRRASSS